MRRSSIVIAALAGALAATSAALAHDALELRTLDVEKQAEALSTTSVVLGLDLKAMPVAVRSARGDVRDVSVVIMDMRSAFRPGFLSRFSRPEMYGEEQQKLIIQKHPVVRISGTVDCATGRAMWNTLDYADTMTGAPATSTKLKNPGNNGNLPQHVAETARVSICATQPANA